MKNKKLFYLNLIYFVATIAVAIIFILGYMGIFTSDFWLTILLQVMIIAGIPILMYTFLCSKNLKTTFKDFGFRKLSGKLILISIALALILHVLNIFISTSFGSIIVLLGYDTSIPTLSVGYKGLLQEFFLTACLPGLCEEILHRGLILNGSKKLGFTKYGLIASSILFGLLHMNIMQFFYATILGFCIGVSVLSTDSIWTGIIIHFTNNFFSVYFEASQKLPLQNLYNTIENKLASLNIAVLIIVLTISIMLLVGLFSYLLRQARKIRANEEVVRLANELKSENLSEIEMNDKLEKINSLLNELKSTRPPVFKNRSKIGFLPMIFLCSTIVLSGLGTIISFIAGIL